MAAGNPPQDEPDRVAQATRRKSDLPVRLASSLVLLALLGLALWQGGWVLDGLVAIVALVVFVELAQLVAKAAPNERVRVAGWIAGGLYVAWAAAALLAMPLELVVLTLGAVICTDSGAYFAGRSIGGPKIAPRISPSKTWAGLAGGMLASGLFCAVVVGLARSLLADLEGTAAPRYGPVLFATPTAVAFGLGALLAIAAQAGDFFESWLKRRAGVKDSSNLIPGHGGLFDRVDGILPVAIIVGILWTLMH
jgi:phosphatidate cytidylyltransferase